MRGIIAWKLLLPLKGILGQSFHEQGQKIDTIFFLAGKNWRKYRNNTFISFPHSVIRYMESLAKVRSILQMKGITLDVRAYLHRVLALALKRTAFEFSLNSPFFVKLTQLAQFDKTSHAW